MSVHIKVILDQKQQQQHIIVIYTIYIMAKCDREVELEGVKIKWVYNIKWLK